jgi:effector-binding domain-containing protein
MLKIGDFSKLGLVTVQALRHYDDLGLLKPAEVDPFTGYRYYAASQLPRLNRILALKDLGFSLEQIADVLGAGLSPEQLRGMLRLKQAEIAQRVQADQERLARVAARLSLIEQEAALSRHEVLLKSVPAQWLASVRACLPTHPAIELLYNELYVHLGPYRQAGGVPVAVWHDEAYKEADVDGEAGILLTTRVPEAGRIRVYEWPAGTVASVVHHGPFVRFVEAYEALFSWIGANGYRITGPGRELYIHLSQPVRQDDDSNVTEIQFPVEKHWP